MQEGVVAIICDAERILFIRRGASVPFPGFWAPVSGKRESGESIPDAVIREVREELGLDVRPVQKLWESTSQDGLFRLHWWSAERVGGSLMPDDREVAEVRWILPTEFSALGNVFEADREFFATIWPRVQES